MTLTQINKAGLDEIALDHVFTIGASGSSAYTFQGEGLNGTVNNPTLYLTRGKTYRFENGSGGHPIRIQSTSGASGTAYNTGVTNNAGSGTVIVEVQHDAPDVLYYQCTSHAAMNGILYITGALADGGVTTAKIADDAVTTVKIAANAVGSSELADNAVDTAAIADDAVTSAKIADGTIVAANIANDTITAVQLANNSANINVIVDGAVSTAKIADDAVTTAKIANDAVDTGQIATNSVTTLKLVDESVTLAKLEHGTSSNDGKFLRANNGADPTFETVTSTTINNNADNRVITGSGTANTLNGESNVIIDSNGHLGVGGAPDFEFQVTDSSGAAVIRAKDGANNKTVDIIANSTGGLIRTLGSYPLVLNTNQTERMRIDSSGRVGIQGTPNSSNFGAKLQVRESGQAATTLTALFGANENASGTTGGISDNTAKACRIGIPHYDTDQKAAAMFVGYTGSGVNELYIGGGTGMMNAATSVRIYADSSSTINNGGNQIARFDSDGLKFGTDTAAANALDDYEEGTFTAYLQSYYDGTSGQVASSDATYTKIGRKVFVQIRWLNSNTNGLNSSGALIKIGGMPFAPDNNKKCITTDFATFNVDFQNTNARHVFETDSNGWYGQLNYSQGSWGRWAVSRWRTSAIYFIFLELTLPNNRPSYVYKLSLNLF
ncbi:hypothetical protein PRQG_00035 [Prochlorococcus phage P-GSP1]|uniref:Tail fiber protein n=1 Tax=Prochlorococcus phage P-GSP1 TaxID=382262 RepID=M1U3K4_9CAUD|nr:hypothetical protein PRQG_00035 [Prochlorococcus phage P-GSP1]AGG54638.1 hypothetical protein PRQG_00035 [Prochlorococcus phage P-GSP1]